MTHSTPIPHLVVSDGEAACTFYQQAFGATVESKHPAEDGKRLMHAHLNLGAGTLYLHDEFPEFGGEGAQSPKKLGGASCTIHIDVADADAAWEQAIKAGGEVIIPLDNQPWGMRYGQIRDPFGHIWSIGGPVKE